MEAELFHADRWTVMTKLIVAFRNFPNAPEKPKQFKFHDSYKGNIANMLEPLITDTAGEFQFCPL